MAAECTQQAQQRMKYYYDQDPKAHPFQVGHKVWIYYLADKQGLSKKLCSLWYDAFGLVDQFSPVSVKVTNLQGKLQKSLVHINRIKQYFAYDDPPINSPSQHNPPGNPPEENYEPLGLFIESPGNIEIELAENMLPNNSQNVITNHIEHLEEINLLPEFTKSLQLKQKRRKRSQDKDSHFSFNTLANCAFNCGKQSVTHSLSGNRNTI